MQWFRFVVPVLPLSVLIACRRLLPGEGHGLDGRAAVVVSLVCLMNVASTLLLASAPDSPGPAGLRKGWKYRDAAADVGRLVGVYIRERWPQDAVVALNTAGSTAYFSERRCIDMLGLNDRVIARREMPPVGRGLPWMRVPGHRKGDGAYVLTREPDFIILGGARGDTRPWFVGDEEILESPSFTRSYRLRQAPIPTGLGPILLFKYFERRR